MDTIIQLFFVAFVLSTAFLALYLGAKNSPRRKLVRLYSEKEILAQQAKNRSDSHSYTKFATEKNQIHEMIRRYDTSVRKDTRR